MTRITAMTLLLSYTSGVALAAGPVPQSQPTQPAAVRIVSAPEKQSDRDLARATWVLATATAVLVLANLVLCVVAYRAARKQSNDARDAIDVAERTADAASRTAEAANQSARLIARQQREALMREVNVVAMRAAVLASRTSQLAATVPNAMLQLLILSGQNQGMPDDHPIRVRTRERSVRTEQISENARGVLNSNLEERSDDELAATLRRMDSLLVELEAMKETVSEELESTESASQARRAENTAMRAAVTVARG